MDKLGTVKFTGRSGNQYRFEAYSLEAAFEKGVSGVYVVTERKQGKTKAGFVHKRIGAGQSSDLCQSLANGGKAFSARGANCFCVHPQTDEKLRQEIEQDLMRRPRPAVGSDLGADA